MKDGTLIAGTETLTPEQQAACIGIVFSINPDRFGNIAKQVLTEKGSAPHGLVMALTDASEGCAWSTNSSIDENIIGNPGEPFYDNTDRVYKMYNNVDGYAETHWIIDKYGNSIQETYPAFYHASIYGTAESGTSQYATPTNTTDWFIPSMGQWWDILSNLGGIDLSSYQEVKDTGYIIPGVGITAITNMNKSMDRIEGADQFRTTRWFWSSSEYSSDIGCNEDFSANGTLGFGGISKNFSTGRLRCIFAF